MSAFLRASLIVCCLAGCGSPLSLAVADLESGRLPDADRRFRSLEPEFPSLGRPERARYALYRGLTHLALGNVREADRWLSAVKRADDRDAGLLGPTERGRLLAAWRAMGRMPGR